MAVQPLRRSRKGTVMMDSHLLAEARFRAASFSLRLNIYFGLLLHNDKVQAAQLAVVTPTGTRVGMALSLPTSLRLHGEANAVLKGFNNLGRYLDALVQHDLAQGGDFTIRVRG